MRAHVFVTILLLLTGCDLGGSKESHSSTLDSTDYSICNEDGTINDLSTDTAADESADSDSSETSAVTDTTTDSETSAVTDTTTDISPTVSNDGLSPAVPNDGIGVLKYATMDIGQAEECELNHSCRILSVEGEKASVEHCGNVTIVVLGKGSGE